MTNKLPKTKKLEVPKTISIKIDDGIVVCAEDKRSPLSALFKHIQDSLNDKNHVDAIKALAQAHGFEVEVSE